LITPLFDVEFPTRPTRTPSRAVIVPAFTTLALAFGDGTSNVTAPLHEPLRVADIRRRGYQRADVHLAADHRAACRHLGK
jgi:hypothetical protein